MDYAQKNAAVCPLSSIGSPQPRLARTGIVLRLAVTILTTVAAGIAVFVIAHTGYSLYHSYRAIPFWDEWHIISEFQKIDQQGLSFDILYKQLNEHRIVLPRLIFLLDKHFAAGTKIIPFLTNTAVQLAHAFLLIFIYQQSVCNKKNIVGNPSRDLVKLSIIASGSLVLSLMLSLVQEEVLTFPINIAVVGVYAAASLSIWFYVRALGERTERSVFWLLGSIITYTVATLNFANGLIVGAVLIFVGLLARAPLWQHYIIGLITAIFIIAYSYDFNYPAHHPSPTLGLTQPLLYLHYFLAYLGNPFRNLGVEYATALGVLGIASTIIIFRRITLGFDTNLSRLALFGISLFIVGTAAITASGRAGFGVAQALDTRCATAGCIFWTTQILYWVSTSSQAQRLWFLPATLGTGILLVLGVLLGEEAARESLQQRVRALDRARDALLSDVVDLNALRAICWDPSLVIAEAKYLRRKRLSVFSSDEFTWLGQPLTNFASLARSDRCTGSAESIDRVASGEGGVTVSGWAYDRKAAAPVSRLVLVDSDGRVSGYASGELPRSDIRVTRMHLTSPNVGWIGYSKGTSGQVIRAFAILQSGRACKIGETKIP